MPAYFTMSIQRKAGKLADNYVEQVYSTIIEAGYPFKSGFWFHQDATFDEIVKWNQTKLKQGFRFAFTEHVSHDYMQILFSAPEYREMRGFWMYSEAGISFNLIIPEPDVLNCEGGDIVLENKIAPIRAMAIKIWGKELADVIQTSVELDYGYFSINEVLNGKNIIAHPFAIVQKDVVAKFNDTYFTHSKLVCIENNGILIKNGNLLSAYLSL